MIALDMPVVDIDSHVTEPPDLWTSRLPAKWSSESPRVVADEATGQPRWLVGRHKLSHVAKYASAGWPEFPPDHPNTLEEADAAAYDPRVREQRMDEYGISAQVLYPNLLAFSTYAFLSYDDPQLRLACVTTYNDFLAEFAQAAPGRFVPVMMLPFWDLEASLREIKRAADKGHKGILFASSFSKIGLPTIGDMHWDPVMALAEDMGLSINTHIGFAEFDEEDLAARHHVSGTEHTQITAPSFMNNGRSISEIICSGLCHRHPDLKFVSVESGGGWLPFLLESLDWHWLNYGAAKAHPERELPSHYFRQNIFGSFWFEGHSIRSALEVLPDNIMFETDFPHPTSLSPGAASYSLTPREMAAKSLEGVAPDVVEKALFRTAAKVYNLDLAPMGARPASL